MPFRPPRSPLFPYTTLFRSWVAHHKGLRQQSRCVGCFAHSAQALWWPLLFAAVGVAVERLVHKKADRKSTRLNSSHVAISYAVFCLKKKNHCRCAASLQMME